MRNNKRIYDILDEAVESVKEKLRQNELVLEQLKLENTMLKRELRSLSRP